MALLPVASGGVSESRWPASKKVYRELLQDRENRIGISRDDHRIARDGETKKYRTMGRDQAQTAVHRASALAVGGDADARHTQAAATGETG
jgi:hypothetical protein